METMLDNAHLRHNVAPHPGLSVHVQNTPRRVLKARYRQQHRPSAYAVTPPTDNNFSKAFSENTVAGPSTRIEPIQRARHVPIGTLFSNGEIGQDFYTCNDPTCISKTFGRVAELKRHHGCEHAAERLQFWCPVPGCDRSKGGAAHAFPRIDKMHSHLSSMHGDVVGRG